MKTLKKAILAVLCLCVVLGTVACGNANDNMNNDVTEGKGVIDDAGDAAGNVIDDIGNGVKDITDDMTGMQNNDTTK